MYVEILFFIEKSESCLNLDNKAKFNLFPPSVITEKLLVTVFKKHPRKHYFVRSLERQLNQGTQQSLQLPIILPILQ